MISAKIEMRQQADWLHKLVPFAGKTTLRASLNFLRLSKHRSCLKCSSQKSPRKFAYAVP